MPSKLAPAFGRLPTHLDLPDSDGVPMDNDFQIWQTMLLLNSIIPHLDRLHPDGRYHVTGDMGVYYQITDPPLQGCKAPDWFYVPNVDRVPADSGSRRSYVMWQELVRPDIVMEFISDKSGNEYDRTRETGKFWVYEQALAVPYYVIYDPHQVKLEVYRMSVNRYELMTPDDRGFYDVQPLRLKLGLHYDTVGGLTYNWLRWFRPDGTLLETGEEMLAEEKVRTSEERERANAEKRRAEQEKQRAEQEKQRAEQEKQRADLVQQRAEKLAQRLRELGLDPEQPE